MNRTESFRSRNVNLNELYKEQVEKMEDARTMKT